VFRCFGVSVACGAVFRWEKARRVLISDFFHSKAAKVAKERKEVGIFSLEGKMKNGKSACFTTDYTDFDGFHGEISLFSNELTAHPAG
jgi:hypothetical protein